MPVIEFDRLIEEYYEKVKDKYPDISLESFTKLCKAPFWFFNKSMGKATMPTIVIKYIGKLTILPSKIKKLIIENNFRFKMGRISEEEFKERETNLNIILQDALKRKTKQTIDICEEDIS